LHCNGTGYKAVVILEEEEKNARKH
jgi:hypothetical protein